MYFENFIRLSDVCTYVCMSVLLFGNFYVQKANFMNRKKLINESALVNKAPFFDVKLKID